MGRVRLLPDALASQVAAGEVVERPASVVKELVENSLDAGAKNIEVQVNRGGASMVRILDDGAGMDRSDALLSIERHATSKIETKEDLDRILTFGFRGEALPSIASVSKFRLMTRKADDISGTEIVINGGKLVAVKDWGGAPGTQIEVRSLFSNVPARRKFLRAENTEYGHVEQQVRVHAISCPEVSFRLVKNEIEVFRLPIANGLRERIGGLAGQDVAKRLLEIPKELEEQEGLKIWGFIGGPGMFRSDRTFQQVFLNGRPVESPMIHFGLREGYHTALMKGQYPIVFLFLEMDPSLVDVNVHPAKKEVRFRDGIGVRRAISRAVSGTLETARMASPVEVKPRGDDQLSGGENGLELSGGAGVGGMPVGDNFVGVSQVGGVSIVESSGSVNKEGVDGVEEQKELLPVSAQISSRFDWMKETASSDSADNFDGREDLLRKHNEESAEKGDDRFRIIGVLSNLYVLMESDEGLVLMDQHAAHERVLFEQMRYRMENEGVPTQRLLMPLTWEVAPSDSEFLKENLEVLARMGVEAEEFGANTFKIDALPTFWRKDDPIGLLSSVLEELRSSGEKTSSMRLGEDMVATTVCRHAVKANDSLHLKELEELVKDLMGCEMPYCCPHGRPTLIQMSYGDLEKKFGRKA